MSSADREVRNLYRKLRQQDAASAPSFQSLTAGRKAAAKASFSRLAAAGSAAAILAVAAGWLLMMRPDPGPSPPDGAALWSRWQSPTGFLLNFGGDSVLKGGPILDIPLPPANQPQTKENDR